MKKLLNTLYVTSENSYLALDGENIVIYDDKKELGRVPLHNLEEIVSSGNQPGTYGCLCRTKYFSVLHDSPGKIPGTGHRESAGERDSAGTTVCQQQR